MSALVAEALGLRLGGVPILRGVDAAFARGQVTAVIGPNGAGKSTLLACLAGLRQPDAGCVRIDGVQRSMLSSKLLAQWIGFLPQTADIHWDIDVRTLIGLGRYPHQGRWGANAGDEPAITRAMAMTDTARFAARPVATLSGGERARVLLARVLAGEPRWLLADEPLANLDPAHQLEGLANLRQVAAAGAGVVVVLHDLNHAAQVADQVLVLREGAVVAHGPPDAVLTGAVIARTFGVAVHSGQTAQGQRFLIPTGPVA